METSDYNDYWFNYVLYETPEIIKEIIEEDYIYSQNQKIHLDIYDNTRAEATILFIHGTSVYSRFYAEFLFTLNKKGYRIVAPDMIGHGKSDGYRGHFTMDEFTQEIYDVTTYILENYDKEVIVMGSSLGGITALYSIANDSRLKAAICHNAAVFNEGAHKKIVKVGGILKLLKPLVPTFAKILPKFRLSVQHYLDFQKLGNSEELKERIDELLEDPLFTEKYTLTSLRTQIRAPMAKPLEDIKQPVLFLNSDDDVLFSVEYMTELYKRLSNKLSSIEIIEKASHLILQENIKESIERMIPWLQKVL